MHEYTTITKHTIDNYYVEILVLNSMEGFWTDIILTTRVVVKAWEFQTNELEPPNTKNGHHTRCGCVSVQ